MVILKSFFGGLRGIASGGAAAPASLKAPVRQPVQHVLMDGQTFVSNLFWQPLSNTRAPAREARTFGFQNGWTWGVIQSGARMQAGFAECSPDLRTLNGTISLAALLAMQLGDAWIGIFKLSTDRYAIVAVHERRIIPGFDVICNAEQAVRLWSEGTSIYAFDANACFAPAELGLAADARNIAPLLAARQWYSVCQIKRLRRYTHPRQVLAGAALALAGFGLMGYWAASIRTRSAAAWPEAESLAQNARHAPQARLNTRLSGQPVSVRVDPWRQHVSAVAFAQTCTAIIGALPLNLAGWHFDHARCEDQTVTAHLNRQAGATVEGLIDAAARWNGTRPLFSGYDRALLHISIKPKGMPVEDDLQPAARLIAGFVSHFQRYGIQAELKPAVRLSTFKLYDRQPDPDWEQLNFNVQSPHAPAFHFTRLARRGVSAGVQIHTITATLEQAALKWRAEGALYVQKR